tara:strand:+ start:3421 stop:3933 length:513 start_codon:yes stop_codon:yes gene_type:complete
MKNKNFGQVLWITGLPGSGKTSIAKKINYHLKKKNKFYFEISGDEIRKIFVFKNFDRKSRLEYAKFYSKICRVLSDKGINVIISTVSLFHEVHKWNRKNINNYKEIYVKSKLEDIINQKKKKLYFNKKNKNLVSKNIKAEYPLNPHILIENKFNNSINYFSLKIIKKLKL